MISLGIDPSLVSTGIVVLDDGKLVLKDTIRSKPTKKKRPKDELDRIKGIVKEVQKIIDEYEPEVVVIEGMAFMAKNTTALVQLAALNYWIRDAAHKRDIPFYIVAPTSLKKFITGQGKAQKDQMMLEIYKRYHVSLLDNNIADGYALARVGQALGDPTVRLTAFQQQVVDLVKPQNDQRF